MVYLVFMVMLTTFAVYTPRPGPDDYNCELYKNLTSIKTALMIIRT